MQVAMRIRIGVVVLALVAQAAAAAPAPEVLALIEGFATHRRAADSYLRTGNPELGLVELERLEARWSTSLAALGGHTAAQPGLDAVFAQVGSLIVSSIAAAERGDGDAAQGALAAADRILRAWRRANGLRLFSDCIDEIGIAYSALDRYRLALPDLMAESAADEVVAAGRAVDAALRACDLEAPAEVARQAEFRRLVDGMKASLKQLPQAVAQRDPAYLYRLLIEQRSYERLLVFRFG